MKAHSGGDWAAQAHAGRWLWFAQVWDIRTHEPLLLPFARCFRGGGRGDVRSAASWPLGAAVRVVQHLGGTVEHACIYTARTQREEACGCAHRAWVRLTAWTLRVRISLYFDNSFKTGRMA